jgi:hypothetical protein
MLVKKRFIKFLLPLLVLMSCSKDFLDINSDPNNPTTIETSKLLPTAIQNLGYGLAIGNGNQGGLSQILEVYVHRMTTRESQDQYNYTGQDFYIGTNWTFMYQSVFENLERIINIATPKGDLHYAGIAKILKAYGYSQMVDAYGDIPFSEANRLDDDIRYAKFDDDAAIYPQLFDLLNEGIADLQNTTALNLNKPGVDDVIYGGDVTKWVKAANTIKLKLYTQVRKVQNVQAEVTALLSNPATLINTTAESFLIPFGPNAATDDRNPGFGDYFATQRSNHISPWFYETMKGVNPLMFTLGNPDPRIPYYIYNQLTSATALTADKVEYRDGRFVSIYFGSRGPDRDRNQQNNLSLLGIYPVGGRYDDGAGGTASATSGTGAAPYRLITYADRLYLEAELINVGLATGNARDVFEKALRESFKQVDYVVDLVGSNQTVPNLMGANGTTPTAEVATYLENVMAKYDAATNEKRLEIIITEKWLSSFGSAVDAYTDYRRTGYPILFNPNNPAMAPGGFVQPPLNGNPRPDQSPQPPVQVQLLKPYPNSLPWYTSELEVNPQSPSQKDINNSLKVFWMP